MIISWISLDNRKKRRATKKRARRAGIELAIHRVTSEAVGGHIVALTMYLISPTKARLDELAAIEAAKHHVVRYIGSIKPSGEVTAVDIEAARDIAQGERVVQIVSRNLLSTDIEDVQFEMAIVAGMAPGSEDPIEHIVVSWPEGEHPTPEQVEEVLDIILAVTGMSRHQAFGVMHGDTHTTTTFTSLSIASIRLPASVSLSVAKLSGRSRRCIRRSRSSNIGRAGVPRTMPCTAPMIPDAMIARPAPRCAMPI